MDSKPLPSQAELAALFDYDPESGVLSWLSRYPSGCVGHQKRFETRYAGKPAGWPVHDGYRGVAMPGSRQKFLVHRVIWKLVTGFDPPFIDHVDLDGGNNRWKNLRDCSKTENQGNRPMHIDNSCGFKNIHWDDYRARWVVQIRKGDLAFSRRTVTLAGAIALQRLKSAEMYGQFARSA